MLRNLHGSTRLANCWSGGEDNHVSSAHTKHQEVIHWNQSRANTNLGLTPHGGFNVVQGPIYHCLDRKLITIIDQIVSLHYAGLGPVF